MPQIVLYFGKIVEDAEEQIDGTFTFDTPRRIGDPYTVLDLETGARARGRLRRKDGGGDAGDLLPPGAGGRVIADPPGGGGPGGPGKPGEGGLP